MSQRYRVDVDFVLDGIPGRETYYVDARDHEQAGQRVWGCFNWEALDLGAMGMKDPTLMRKMTARPARRGEP